jgi:hypothetical protein
MVERLGRSAQDQRILGLSLRWQGLVSHINYVITSLAFWKLANRNRACTWLLLVCSRCRLYMAFSWPSNPWLLFGDSTLGRHQHLLPIWTHQISSQDPEGKKIIIHRFIFWHYAIDPRFFLQSKFLIHVCCNFKSCSMHSINHTPQYFLLMHRANTESSGQCREAMQASF